MKTKALFSASLFVAGLAFAGTTQVTDEYVLGAMPLTISGKEVIINIPWVEAGSGGTTIAVSNIVKTANLAAGDKLLWYNPSGSPSGYRAWELTDGVGGVKYWNAISSVTMSGVSVVAADTPALSRGQALILNRSADTATTIYIVGQYTSSNASATISPGYNLLAPPATSGVTDLKSLTWTGAVAGDKIIVPPNVDYVWDGEKWVQYSYDKTENPQWQVIVPVTMPISVGTGFWYVHGGSGSFDITWP